MKLVKELHIIHVLMKEIPLDGEFSDVTMQVLGVPLQQELVMDKRFEHLRNRWRVRAYTRLTHIEVLPLGNLMADQPSLYTQSFMGQEEMCRTILFNHACRHP